MIEKVEIPRCYFGTRSSKDIRTLQLHIFTDASEVAYGCVAYFRFEMDGKSTCTLVTSKSKVAPLKVATVPKLDGLQF